MGIMRFNYRSQALGYYVDVSVVFPTDKMSYYDENSGTKFHATPPAAKARPWVYKPGMKFQTVYLIHGGSDDDTLTYRYTNAERFAQENSVMLVTPNIANSFGVDTKYGIPYQTFLAEELPVVIQSLFASSPKREDNFIMGYAMGGNIALGTAIMHPEMFHTCVDMSGGIGMTMNTQTLKDELDGDHFRNNFCLFNSSFGESGEIDGSRFDIYSAAKKHREEGAELSKFYIICGSKEFVRGRIEGDVKILKELKYDIEYICANGYDHDFKMWNDYIEISLGSLLPLKRRPIYGGEQ